MTVKDYLAAGFVSSIWDNVYGIQKFVNEFLIIDVLRELIFMHVC